MQLSERLDVSDFLAAGLSPLAELLLQLVLAGRAGDQHSLGGHVRLQLRHARDARHDARDGTLAAVARHTTVELVSLMQAAAADSRNAQFSTELTPLRGRRCVWLRG
jgi:hypothetical protein